MKAKSFIYLILLILITLSPDSRIARAQQSSDPATSTTTPVSTIGGFELQQVAPGIHAAIRKEPPGLMFNANSIFIINDDDVVVVDTNITPSSAKEVLAALKKLTDKPVKYVINTHWHDDHIIGNQVYREAYPGVEFIAHTSMRVDLSTIGLKNRQQLQQGAPEALAQIRTALENNKSLSGEKLTSEERVSYLSDITQVERYLSEIEKFQIVMPTIEVTDKLTLYRGSRIIEIQHLGRGHSGADIIVNLPQTGVLITGDLIVSPVPLIGSTSFPAEYANCLDKLLGFKAKIIIPGHGAIMQDDSYIKLMASMLKSLTEQTEAAVTRGETLEQTRKSVNLSEYRNSIAGDSQLKKLIFDFYVKFPGVEAAYKQASVKKSTAGSPVAKPAEQK